MINFYTFYEEATLIKYADKEGNLKESTTKHYKYQAGDKKVAEFRKYKIYLIDSDDDSITLVNEGICEDIRKIKGYYITVNRIPSYVRCDPNVTPKIIKKIFPKYEKGNFTLNKNY
jgi:hypothetical protein